MKIQKYQAWIEFALMLIVSAGIYLPFISQFGYYNDDWYSMYAARVAGPQIFHEIYGLDRPGRRRHARHAPLPRPWRMIFSFPIQCISKR